jgi:hypothetical protein
VVDGVNCLLEVDRKLWMRRSSHNQAESIPLGKSLRAIPQLQMYDLAASTGLQTHIRVGYAM